jgi:hypothetical protein
MPGDWFATNSAALQNIAALSSLVLTIVSIGVLFVTWRAVKRQAIASELQAEAAKALTAVAQEQTQAAQEAARAANTQCDLLSSQLELEIAPLLVAEPDDRPNMVGYKIVNRGKGAAFQVLYWNGGFEKDNLHQCRQMTVVSPSTLAPNAAFYLPIPTAWECWTVRYRGIDRQERWTIVYRDGRPQEHVMRKGSQEVYLA